jgi:hypothetical protein
VLVVQPAAELLFTDGKRLWIGIGLDLVAQRRAEFNQRLERRLAGLGQLPAHIRRRAAKHAHHLGDQLATTPQHSEAGVDEYRRRLLQRCARLLQKLRYRGQPGKDRRGSRRQLRLGSYRQGVEALKEMAEPEARVPDLRLLVLQPKRGGADFAQQRGPIDFARQLLRLQLFGGSAEGAECSKMNPGGLRVEAAQPGIHIDPAGGTTGSGIEVILEVQVGPAEIVYR